MALRVLVVHNSYGHRGGEDSVVESEVELLRRNGNTVLEFRDTNNRIEEVGKFNVLKEVFWSRSSADRLKRVLADFLPDVVHVHNTFVMISPSIYWVVDEAGIPVVQTLHNFRLFCPQAMFLRGGHVCEDCLGKVPWRGVTRRCYRESHLQSAVSATITYGHRLLGTWNNKVTRYIALNDFCRNKFIEGGLPESKVVVKPNFVEWSGVDDEDALPEQDKTSFLFVGRLSAEKGIGTLADAARNVGVNGLIRVVGGGPEETQLRGVDGVSLVGALDSLGVKREMSRSVALVMPSIWYENFPRTLVEAFACGLPVIASRLGALAELVKDGHTGLLFNPGDSLDLSKKLRWAMDNPGEMKRMGCNAKAEFDAKYSPEKNYSELMDIYKDAIESSAKRRVS